MRKSLVIMSLVLAVALIVPFTSVASAKTVKSDWVALDNDVQYQMSIKTTNKSETVTVTYMSYDWMYLGQEVVVNNIVVVDTFDGGFY